MNNIVLYGMINIAIHYTVLFYMIFDDIMPYNTIFKTYYELQTNRWSYLHDKGDNWLW